MSSTCEETDDKADFDFEESYLHSRGRHFPKKQHKQKTANVAQSAVWYIFIRSTRQPVPVRNLF